MIEDVIADAEQRMQKTVESLKRELATIRTGRASPALIERLPVDYYGVPTPLQQLAQITVAEARTLVITPYDRGAFASIEKAIQKSDLGLNPTNDGRVIRIVFPPLTEERRRDLVKLVRKYVEEHKVALRNIRRDADKTMRELQKEGGISSDQEKRAEDRLQKLTDQASAEIERIGKQKEAEVLEV
ncbi:MAG: ribosome recycling factor [Chloroflexota bacterium]|nr:ribosome recycling factor [Dehalococcoidia bacterium]MDW8253520.1 ribosome recycling factor [Chloroflexota bacterium]